MRAKILLILFAVCLHQGSAFAQTAPESACDAIEDAQQRENCVAAEIKLEQIDAMESLMTLQSVNAAASAPNVADPRQEQLNQLYDEYRAIERKVPGAFYPDRPTH